MTKEERANLAECQTQRRDVVYKNNTIKSIMDSQVFRNTNLAGKQDGTYPVPTIEYIQKDTVGAFFTIELTQDEKACLLNFASYKNPGGGYIKGSMAQEEALCTQSNLYNILGSHALKEEYTTNRKNLPALHGLYENWAIYTPDVVFESPYEDLIDFCDVVTCPSPNKRELLNSDLEGDKNEINRNVLDSRIEFMLDACSMNKPTKVNTLIIGAWGSGVFGQDVNEVAELFAKHLLSGKYSFDRIIVAVPEQDKLNVFKKAFSK